MISKELQEKILLLIREIGIMKGAMYFCYMCDHIFASIRRVFPDE